MDFEAYNNFENSKEYKGPKFSKSTKVAIDSNDCEHSKGSTIFKDVMVSTMSSALKLLKVLNARKSNVFINSKNSKIFKDSKNFKDFNGPKWFNGLKDTS